jgi:hypothetical protein
MSYETITGHIAGDKAIKFLPKKMREGILKVSKDQLIQDKRTTLPHGPVPKGLDIKAKAKRESDLMTGNLISKLQYQFMDRARRQGKDVPEFDGLGDTAQQVGTAVGAALNVMASSAAAAEKQRTDREAAQRKLDEEKAKANSGAKGMGLVGILLLAGLAWLVLSRKAKTKAAAPVG